LETDFRDRLQTTLTGAYRVERELGGGGMSRVFLAEERALCRRVVVKVLSPELAAGVNFERFKHEILLTAQLQHPHILPVFTTGETEGLPYYTMPFVEGESLRVHLMRAGAMPIAAAISILRDVARALEFAHAKGVVHRDIKPDNILLAGNTATVSDFGIAKALLASHAVTVSAPRTDLGIVIGTPLYMAPEQAAADTGLDHRVDLYALGCVAYEMIAGEPPFAGSVASLIRAHIVDAPPPIVTKRADVPEALAVLVERCLQKDPADRPASAREILEVLDNLASAHTSGPGSMVGTEVPTIAVLPFGVVTGDEQETDHFADGLTDEVITDLSMIKTLRVISRQSAMRLKGSDKDLRTIARELGARYVLTGSIRRAGSSLRITAQLVDARTDAQLWADKFHGALEDVFEIQERLSRQPRIGAWRSVPSGIYVRTSTICSRGKRSGASTHNRSTTRSSSSGARRTLSATTSCCSSPRDSSTGSMSTWASYPCRSTTSTCGRRKTAPRRCSHSTRNPRKGTVFAERSDTTVPTRTERLATTRRRWCSIPTIRRRCSGLAITTLCPGDPTSRVRSWIACSRWIH
jgi:serine/threonine protein kinase